TFQATYEGFVNGEDGSVVSGTLTCSTDATAVSPIGTYSISNCSGLSAANYSIVYAPGVFSVQYPEWTKDFGYTGTPQTLVVPIGVTSLDVALWGGAGGDSFDSSPGGGGGYVNDTIAVTPGQVMNVFVGGRGTDGTNGGNSPGGWNGGGLGAFLGGGGGG